ncbi:MAG: hypothetical protein IKL59_05305 [Clostridia bacterium]|nr:hypothetical protein [Clostridia bacterium]
MLDLEKVRYLYEVCSEKMGSNIKCFKGMDKPLPMISEFYPGVWLEASVSGAIFLAWDNSDRWNVAENVINVFIDNQTDDGQLPCYILDANAERTKNIGEHVGYSQIQECVSFARLCLIVYKENKDRAFLEKCYEANKAWDGWLRRNRMTTGRGLIEMFCGYDTGHDNSGRLVGMSCKYNYGHRENGVVRHYNAAVLPPDDGITPMLAPDMNCTFYATQIALSEMADILGKPDEAAEWREKAKAVKAKLIEHCYNDEDAFFYDVDRNGNQRKYLSISIHHLFMEHVLDKDEDAEMIKAIYEGHLKNPDEFWTPYPFPATAISDPYWQNLKNPVSNNWGYYTQTLTLQRCRFWMDDYGYTEDFDEVCRRWIEAYTDNFDKIPFGQEIHPITGEPTDCSEWCIGVMNFYRYVVNRLKLLD